MRALLAGLAAAVGLGIAVMLLLPRQQEPSHPQEPPQPREGHGEDGAHSSFAKIHFMRKFAAALSEPPRNLMPAPGYEPLLKEGAAAIRCADCHTDASLDMDAMIANDPGDEAAQPFRMQRRRFMIPLMEKWVGRLNKLHGDRLRKEVGCTDCHAVDPHDDAARNAVIPPLMVRFVKALKEPPGNKDRAPGWTPLLKDPATPSMLCAACHGQVGAVMERNIALLEGPPPAAADENRAFMTTLMERWTRELNKRMKDRLVKAVVCTDCHETDPRK